MVNGNGNDPLESFRNSVELVKNAFAPLESSFKKVAKDFEHKWPGRKTNIDLSGVKKRNGNENGNGNGVVSDDRKKKVPFLGIFAFNDSDDCKIDVSKKDLDSRKEDGTCVNCMQFAVTWSLLVSSIAQAVPGPFKNGKKKLQKKSSGEYKSKVSRDRIEFIAKGAFLESISGDGKRANSGNELVFVPCEETLKIKDVNGLAVENFIGFVLDQIAQNLHKFELGRSTKDHPDKKKLFSVQDFFRYTEAEGRRFFEELDRDGDGQVTLEDLEIAIRKRKLPRRYAHELMRRTRRHLFSKSFGWQQFLSLMEQKEPTILRAYTSLCLTKSGTLQKSEILASLKNAGLPANEDNAVAMMRFLKSDTEESISYGHFRNFMVLLPSDQLQEDPRNLWFQAATVVAVAPPVEVHTGSVLKSALAGGLACALSTSVMHPIDTIKTRVQASTLSFPEMIAKLPEVGFRGVYRGSIPAIIGQFSSHGLRTGIFEASKIVLINVSTVLGTAVRIPCEVLKQRLQAGIFNNVGEAIICTWQQDGLKGFFRGTGATLCREVPFYVAGMGLYGESKKAAQKLLGRELEPWETIAVGALSGGVHGVHDEKRVWFEVELHGAQGDREAEVFQVSNDDTAVAQRRLKDKQPEEEANTDCLRSTQQCIKSGVAKHLDVAGIHHQNGLVDDTNVTFFAKVRCFLIQSGLSKVFWREDTTRYGFNAGALQEVEFEVEPQKDHTFEVEPHGNVDHVVGSHEVKTQDLMDYQLARDRDQHLACELFGYREDDNEAAFAIVIFKWKAGLKDAMNAWSDVNGCKKCSDNNDGYYREYTPVKTKRNVLGLEIIRDESGNTLRVSQSRIHNEKLIQTLLKGHLTLSLKDSLLGDCDVKKNGKWSCIYAAGSQEYQMVCTRLDIASTNVDHHTTRFFQDLKLYKLQRSQENRIHHPLYGSTDKNLGMQDMFAVKAVDKVLGKNDAASKEDVQAKFLRGRERKKLCEMDVRSKNSNASLLERLSCNIFITIFRAKLTGKELWNTCSQYVTVLDVFIPKKLSKQGKPFAFARFNKVTDVDSLINNLRSVWLGNFRVYANVARFNRETNHNFYSQSSKAKAPMYVPSFVSAPSFAKVVKGKWTTPFEVPDKVVWINVEGVPLQPWSHYTFTKIANRWEVIGWVPDFGEEEMSILMIVVNNWEEEDDDEVIPDSLQQSQANDIILEKLHATSDDPFGLEKFLFESNKKGVNVAYAKSSSDPNSHQATLDIHDEDNPPFTWMISLDDDDDDLVFFNSLALEP
nr:mitochondrial substrate carrier family protein C [Tanacetum cinerariifolium]